ncbi:hypothetical protein [Pseudomonas sp. HS6]|uniref:hypothetical protein n=1 Tax=Pseudomonas sp. HS6 TaxID=2850559 RepID=UPI00201A02FD|nr:hypothetical protein [Pseudomonas sp. HS6]UQS17669.1 hypothetical protein JJN09_12650 [Pseudomonas sp. HS6]
MFNELVFTQESPTNADAYAGGGVYLPSDVVWPQSTEGQPLTHFISFPGAWFSDALVDETYWVSVFIPYLPGEVGHYRKLRAINGVSEAVVIGYFRSNEERNEASNKIMDCGKILLSSNPDSDDDENLASKLDGVDAWLQAPISSSVGRRRLSIYGGDVDVSLPNNKGILSDGMGYLFLDDEFAGKKGAGCGRFFLQLG